MHPLQGFPKVKNLEFRKSCLFFSVFPAIKKRQTHWLWSALTTLDIRCGLHYTLGATPPMPKPSYSLAGRGLARDVRRTLDRQRRTSFLWQAGELSNSPHNQPRCETVQCLLPYESHRIKTVSENSLLCQNSPAPQHMNKSWPSDTLLTLKQHLLSPQWPGCSFLR